MFKIVGVENGGADEAKQRNLQRVFSTQPPNPLAEIGVYADFKGMDWPGSRPVQSIIGTVNILIKCLSDLDDSGFVDDADFVIFSRHYNLMDCTDPAMPQDCPSDFNKDGVEFSIFIQSHDLPVCL